MTSENTREGAGRKRLAHSIIDAWALAGGLLLLAVVLMNTASIAGSWLFATPVPGDVELTQMGVAISAFMFLPYCQLRRLNVSADIFTSAASTRWLGRFSAIASIIAMIFGGLLVWRMYFGMESKFKYNNLTTILQIQEWIVFVPILLSLALLVVAAYLTLREDLKASRGGS